MHLTSVEVLLGVFIVKLQLRKSETNLHGKVSSHITTVIHWSLTISSCHDKLKPHTPRHFAHMMHYMSRSRESRSISIKPNIGMMGVLGRRHLTMVDSIIVGGNGRSGCFRSLTWTQSNQIGKVPRSWPHSSRLTRIKLMIRFYYASIFQYYPIIKSICWSKLQVKLISGCTRFSTKPCFGILEMENFFATKNVQVKQSRIFHFILLAST